MPAAIVNLTIEQGATWREKFQIKVDQGNGLVISDLTGYTARLQARPELTSSTVYLDLTTENGKVTIEGSQGIIRLKVSATETAALNWAAAEPTKRARAVYQLEIKDPAGNVERLLKGTITLDPKLVR